MTLICTNLVKKVFKLGPWSTVYWYLVLKLCKSNQWLEDYFSELFSTSNPTQLDGVLEATPWVVTEAMNEGLLGVFSKREVDLALKRMASLKALGLDGMLPIFYQHYWSLIGDDVSLVVLSYLNSGTLLVGLNHTYITLVSKTKSTVRVTEFRPVALCNIIYKLISKVLAKWLLSQIIKSRLTHLYHIIVKCGK